MSKQFKMWIAILSGGGTILFIWNAPIELWMGVGSIAIFYATLMYVAGLYGAEI